MECPNCRHINADGASYCSNCGEALPLTCPVCSHALPPGARFCPNCGHRLVPEPGGDDPGTPIARIEAARGGTMAGERRTVTMLFADVKGSTAAAEQLDPEDWAEVINGAFERMIQPVYRYEGTLARLQGDAVLAFFGAPVAHEDDPERAIMAGLEMVSAIAPYSRRVEQDWGIPIQIRVGINTGLVVVGEVGSDLKVEYTALGDAVNIAARMEQTAEPGTVQVSEDTYRQVAPLFEFAELGQTHVKGKSEPLATFRPLRRLERPGATRGVPGLRAEMVGRHDELGALLDLTDRLQEGLGGVCTVMGDAGVGKSRLLSEFRHALETDGRLGPWWSATQTSLVGWGQGRCLSYNTSVPYWPVADLISFCLDIHQDDADASKRAKLTDVLEGLLPDRAPELEPYLGMLLDIEPTPAEEQLLAGMRAPLLQRRTYDAVSALMAAAATARPLVIVLEDLHWADAVSLALLEELMAITERASLLIVVTMRPYREDPSWRFHEVAGRRYEHRYTALALEPLDHDAAEQMLTSMLGDSLPQDLRATLVTRSEGNPFYLEEILNSLIDAGALVDEEGAWRATEGVGGVDISPTVTGLLTSRLDRLDEGARVIAQLASVIGREFRLSELEHLTGGQVDVESSLADLLRRNLFEERSRLPERIFAFRHALVQETAYRSVLRRARRRLHLDIATLLEETRPDDIQEIALHLWEAGEERRALPHLVEAGDRAARAMSLKDAIDFYSKALSVRGEEALDLTRRAHEGLGGAYTLIPDLTHAATAYQEMLEFGRSQSEPRIQVTALNRLGFTAAALGGDYDTATEYLEGARRLAEEHDDELGLAEYHINSCMIATGRGDLEAAAVHDAGVAASGKAAGSHHYVMQGLVQRAISLANAGLYEEGEVALAEAARAAEESGDELFEVGVTAVGAPPYLLREGRVDEAYQAATHGFEVTDRRGSSWAGEVSMMAAYLGRLLGRYEESLSLDQDSVRISRQLGQPYVAAASAAHAARVYAEAGGDAVERARWEEEALGYLEETLGDMFSSTIWSQLGWAAWYLGEFDTAAGHFEKSLSASSATRYLERPWSLVGSAETSLALGRLDEAHAHVEQARSFVDDKQLATARPALALVQGRLALAERDPVGALGELDPAEEAAQRMGLLPDLWRLQAEISRARSLVGDHDGSAAAAGRAVETIERIAADIVDVDLHDRFMRVARAGLAGASPPLAPA